MIFFNNGVRVLDDNFLSASKGRGGQGESGLNSRYVCINFQNCPQTNSFFFCSALSFFVMFYVLYTKQPSEQQFTCTDSFLSQKIQTFKCASFLLSEIKIDTFRLVNLIVGFAWHFNGNFCGTIQQKEARI